MNVSIYLGAIPKCVKSINLEGARAIAVVCAWCQPFDKPGDTWAERKGMVVSHTICRDCAKKQTVNDVLR